MSAEAIAIEQEPLIALERIHVAYDATVALANETFRVRPGEIVGLLGHNGAGKSTLVNVATGAVKPKHGTMTIAGEAVPLRGNPRLIEQLGVKVIHQEPALAGNLSIADNITLGREDERLSRRARRRRAREALQLLDSNLNVNRHVETLDFGQRQVVDLARALSTTLQVLFLDEPTGALGKHETERLHDLLRRLARDGRGIVYVSHRLRDVVEICSRIVVLREGQIVLDEPAQRFTLAELSDALAPGMSSDDLATRSDPAKGGTALTLNWGGQEFSFQQGAVIGLFGMAAGPQFALLEALFGIGANVVARLDGHSFAPRSPREAIRCGVYLVSADRERDGLFQEMSAAHNLTMPWLSRCTRRLVLSRPAVAHIYERARTALDIRGPEMTVPIGAFSGGNRQKVVVGRWLFGIKPRVLLLSQPTQGVDVGARADIAHALRQLAEEGVTVLVASAEADEITLLCDSALVCEGETWHDVPRGEGWDERLLEGLISEAAG